MAVDMITTGLTYDDALTWIESLGCVPKEYENIDQILDTIDPGEAIYYRSEVDYWRGFCASARGVNPHTNELDAQSKEWWRGYAISSDFLRMIKAGIF